MLGYLLRLITSRIRFFSFLHFNSSPQKEMHETFIFFVGMFINLNKTLEIRSLM